MGIEDYTLNGGINSRVEEILSTGLDATPESIPGLIEELKNREYRSDMEYLLGCLRIEQLEQRLNSQGTSGVIMGYQEDLRNAISVLQSRVDELDAGEQGDLSEIQSALNTLQTTVNSLSTTVQGKANSTDVASALSAKASLSDLAAIDTKTRNLENSMSAKADKSELDAKANVDVYAELDTKASTSYVTQMLDTKASKDAVNAKANTTDVEERFAQMTTVVNGKASATMWSNVEIPVSGWSASAPYTQTVTVSGMLATYNPTVDIKFTDNTTIADEKSYYSCIDRITTGDDSITLVCLDEKPAGTFHINLKEVS